MKFAELQFDDFEFREQLGSGSFGTVYRAIWKSENMEIAAKKILNLGDEAHVLSVLSHKHIIQFYGAITSPPNYCLITEFAKHGSLYDYITSNELDFQQILTWSKQIAIGISYLHNEAPFKIIHRDLKSKNVVITGDMVVKLCDFGSSRYFTQTTKMSIAGTYPWMAPEVIQSMPVSEACDTFSYGIVLWEMLTREVPFKGFDGVQVQYLVVVKEERLAIPSSCPEKFSKLLASCWMADPKQRPTFTKIQSILQNMCEDDVLKDETNSFIKNKTEWMSEMKKKFDSLKNIQLQLTSKEKELRERELRLIQKEQSINVVRMLNKTDINDWDVNDVYLWINQLGYEAVDLIQYAQIFFDNHINGKRLSILSIQDLFEMGITSFGHRKELQYRISQLIEELEHLAHFPPLHPSPSIESEISKQRTVQLTLLFGNHCRLGPTPMDHKWKVYVEVDGEDEALNAIKDVQLKTKDNELILSSEPYVMPKWHHAGDNNYPIFVECLVTYQNNIKKPRTTKHTHEVLIKKGGCVVQRTIELLVKESPSITSVTDEGYSTSSPSLSRMNTCRMPSSRVSSCSLSSAFSSINDEPVSWANRVKGESPPAFMIRKISEANKEVLLRNREMAGSPSFFKRKSSWERPVAIGYPEIKKDLNSEFKNMDLSCDTLKSLNKYSQILRNTLTNETVTNKKTENDTGLWTVVKNSKKHGNQKRQGKGYNRSQSDPLYRKENDIKNNRSHYSESDRDIVIGRGRGFHNNRGRGYSTRGRGRGNYSNAKGYGFQK